MYHVRSADLGILRTVLVGCMGILFIAVANGIRFPAMFEEVGVAESAGVCVALMVGVSVLPTMVLQWKGHSFRPAAME